MTKPSHTSRALRATLLTASLFVLAPVAQAQLLGSLIDSAVSGAVEMVKSELATTTTSSTANSSGTKPGATSAAPSAPRWTGSYTQYAYTKTAPQPSYNGMMGMAEHPDWYPGLNFKTLPLQHAIVRVHGNGARKVAMFSDPTCPYSRELEKTLNAMDNITIYTFVLPLLGEKGRAIATQVNCQPTNQARAQAWDNWMLNGVPPPQVAGCATAMDKVLNAMGTHSDEKGNEFRHRSPVLAFQTNITTIGALSRSNFERVFAVK